MSQDKSHENGDSGDKFWEFFFSAMVDVLSINFFMGNTLLNFVEYALTSSNCSFYPLGESDEVMIHLLS